MNPGYLDKETMVSGRRGVGLVETVTVRSHGRVGEMADIVFEPTSLLTNTSNVVQGMFMEVQLVQWGSRQVH